MRMKSSLIPLHHLVIFDDMLGDKDEEKIKVITEMLLWCTSHKIYFSKVKHLAQLILNAHYLILFQSPRDKMQIKVLSNQLQAPHMIHAFNDATSKPHGYLLVDLKNQTHQVILDSEQIFFKTGLRNQINRALLSIFQ